MNHIGDYAPIGDCHSMAMVGIDGSIDWACFPRFDSPSVFGRLLDDRAGHFSVRPVEPLRSTTRSYLAATNVVQTTFRIAGGTIQVVDSMPVEEFDPDDPAKVRTHASILRRIRCAKGSAEVRIEICPRFEYGIVMPRIVAEDPWNVSAVGGPDALWIRTSRPIDALRDRVGTVWSLEEGDECWIEASWTAAADPRPHEPVSADLHGTAMAARFASTLSFWENWFATCSYDGDHHRRVHRSALMLKLLTYAPTGAMLAAGTTSLPEWVGGPRNWDYRFTWIRDATLALSSLVLLGYLPEAVAFKGWLERTGAGRPSDLQIMYRVTGERLLPELTLDHLRGHRDSLPVRIGNGAAGQLQLDSLGQLLEAAFLFTHVGGELTESNADFLRGVADLTVLRWQRPDQGIWEIRDEPRHFVHSKLNCWMALDRAVRMNERGQLDGDVQRWRTERDGIVAWLLSEGCPDGWFVQAAGFPYADAAALLVPAFGLLPPADPRVQATIDVVRRDLSDGVHVRRYQNPDGLPGEEGAFLLCSFWLVDALVHSGRLDEGEELFEELLAMGNDVGVYSEMVDPTTGEQLGNTPQAFTHMAVVTSASAISAARRSQLPPPTEAFSFLESSIDRRLAPGRRASQ